MKSFYFVLSLIFLFTSFSSLKADTSPLAPVKLDHPRDTMMSFITAMNDYKKGMETDNQNLKNRIDDAVRCLNLSEVPFVLRKEKGRESAVLLKEVIDRVIVIDYNRIPEDKEEKRWRLKNTEIVIAQVQKGDHVGEFLFSSETIFRAKDFFGKVKKLPYKEGSFMGAAYAET